MIENVKLIFALQKFGFQRRLQLGSMAIFYLIGVVIELATRGTFWLGMFFMMLVLHIYTAFVYKFYVLSIVLLFVIIWPISFYMGYSVSGTSAFSLPTIPVSFAGAVLIAYASTLIGVGLQCALAKLIYRAPLSKYAQGAAMRKYLKN